ncbi:MAG: tetratricopeptide repeat protein [Deltaproteobacteria bacterium]|nr:MAG: tetratricopeptide repeat protein [Deltaproteobacteria bacterium]
MFVRAIVSTVLLLSPAAVASASPPQRSTTSPRPSIPKPGKPCPPLRSQTKKSHNRRPAHLQHTFPLFVSEKTKGKPPARQELQKTLVATPARQRATLYFQLAKLDWSRSQKLASQARKSPSLQARVKALRRQSARTLYTIMKNYPRFSKNCEVYFLLGRCLSSLGKAKAALHVYRVFLQRFGKKYPSCPYAPHAYLAFGDYYFNKGQVRTALTSYQNVLKYPNNSVYNYALYKAGWSYFNLVQYRKALRTFAKVSQRTLTTKKTHPRIHKQQQRMYNFLLRREALRDLVLSYSYVGSTQQALPFFTKASSPSHALAMLKQLGRQYQDQGKFASALTVYQTLERKASSDENKLRFQLKQLQMAQRMSSMKQVMQLAKSVAQRVQRSQTKPGNRTVLQTTKQRICCELRSLAQQRHYESQKTRSNRTLRHAAMLYKLYLSTCPTTQDSYTYHFWLGAIHFRLRQYNQAGQHYTSSFQLKKVGKVAENAAYNAVIAYRTNTDKANKQARSLPAKTPKRQSLLAFQRAYKACKQFLQRFPSSEYAPHVRYIYAQMLYRKSRFIQALPHLFRLVRKHPKHPIASNAARLILDIYNIQKKWKKLQQAAIFFSQTTHLGNQPFKKEIHQVVQQSTYKICQVQMHSQSFAEAGKCFSDVTKKFPRSRWADKALFNAALSYQRAKKDNLALQARILLTRHYPHSPLSAPSLWAVASYYSMQKNHLLASRYFGMYVYRYRQARRTLQAMLFQATHLEASGSTNQAMQVYKRLLSSARWRTGSPRRFVAVYFHVAKHQKKQKKYKLYAAMMKRFLNKRWGTPRQRRYARKEYRWALRQKP